MTKRKPSFLLSSLSILALAAAMFTATVIYGAEPHLPLIVGAAAAAAVATYCGYKWEEITESMIAGISQSLESMLILLCIGLLVATWILSGTVPALIYYGLKLINPRAFLVTAYLICSAISMVMGAWGAAGSIGLAFMGIGQAMGISPAMIAGVIVSGVYVGDKLSPFSDATNLAASVTGVNTFEMIKDLFGLKSMVLIAAGAAYTVLGFTLPIENADSIRASIDPLLADLAANFNISPLALIPLAVMILCVFIKVPSIPALLCGAAVACVQALLIQDASLGDIFALGYEGYISTTGNELLDGLLSAGGILAMMETISVILIAMGFGGIMQGSGQMEALVKPIAAKIRAAGGMIALTIVTCMGVNIVLPEQYLAIMVPGQMYSAEYDRRGIDRLTLGNVLGAGASVTSPLVPWNTCGMYMSSILSVGVVEYLPFAFFNYLMPLFFLVYFFIVGGKRFPAQEKA